MREIKSTVNIYQNDHIVIMQSEIFKQILAHMTEIRHYFLYAKFYAMQYNMSFNDCTNGAEWNMQSAIR